MSSSRAPDFAVTEDVESGGDAVLVGMGGRLAVLCAAAAIDHGLRVVLCPDAGSASARLARKPARIVVVPGGLAESERTAIAHATRASGAELVELPRVVDEAAIAHRIALAVRRTHTGEEAPATQPSNVISSAVAR